IARAHRESIDFTHRWHADDLDIKVQVPHHPLNRAKLLKILLAEERDVWFDNVEEFGDDGGDASEVTRPMLSAKSPGYFRDINPRLKIVAVDSRRLWRKDNINRNRAHHL